MHCCKMSEATPTAPGEYTLYLFLLGSVLRREAGIGAFPGSVGINS